MRDVQRSFLEASMSYDSKCYELAAAFLAEEDLEMQSDANRSELAQRIQDVIEDFLRKL